MCSCLAHYPWGAWRRRSRKRRGAIIFLKNRIYIYIYRCMYVRVLACFLTKTFKMSGISVLTGFPYQNLQTYIEHLCFHKLSCLAHCPWGAWTWGGSRGRGARLQKTRHYLDYMCFHQVSLQKALKVSGLPAFSKGLLTKTVKIMRVTCVFTGLSLARKRRRRWARRRGRDEEGAE